MKHQLNPTRDEAELAQVMLNGIIAKIDTALATLEARKAILLPDTFATLNAALGSHRNKALWYLGQPNHGGRTALGMMGGNGRGLLIDRDIASVTFHITRALRVAAFQSEIAA